MDRTAWRNNSSKRFKGKQCLGKTGRADHTHLLPSGRTAGVPSSFATGNTTTIPAIFVTIGCCEHAVLACLVSLQWIKWLGTVSPVRIYRWKSNVLLLCFIATYGLGSTFQLSLLFRAQADSDIITVLYCLLAWNKSFRLLTEHTVSTCSIFWFWSYFPKITRKLHTFVPSSSSAPKIGWYWPATARVQGLPKSSVMTCPSPTSTILHSAGLSHRMHSSSNSCLGIFDAYILPSSSF